MTKNKTTRPYPYQEIIQKTERGYEVVDGVIRGVDTSKWPLGTNLWLTASGDYTEAKPANPISKCVVIASHPKAGAILKSPCEVAT